MKALVNVQVDAEKGEGKDLAKKFNVHGFPTLVIVDAGGSEIDRIVGYRPPEKFTPEIQRILKGEDTLPALRAKVAAAADDLAASMALAKKLAVAAPAEAVTLLEKVVLSAKGKDRAVEASAWMTLSSAAQNAGDKDRARTAAEKVLSEFGESEAAGEALGIVVSGMMKSDPDAVLAFVEKARKEAKNPKVAASADGMLVNLHLRALGQSLKRQGDAAGDDPMALNQVAWTCFEHKMNLKEAVAWARKAVEASKRDPMILDTLANLLFVTNEADEAVKIEEEAVDHAKGPLQAELSETLVKFQVSSALRKAHAAAKPAGAGGAAQSAAGAPAKDEDGEEGDEDDD